MTDSRRRDSHERHLEWEGCFNVRDLGGLPARNGCVTRWGEVIRADSLGDLTEAGWQALIEHGVRTVIDLRNDDERGQDAATRPIGLTTIHVPLDVSEDREFWTAWESGPQFATPLYYRPHLERFPERSAAVIAEIARARPGGVVFHCAGGRDRAGQVAMLALALAGVSSEEIVEDYLLSIERLPVRYAARGETDQGPLIEAFLESKGTSAGEVLAATLGNTDIEATLRAGGLTPEDVSALRERLVAPRQG